MNKILRLLMLCRKNGLKRLVDIETFVLVCENPGLTSIELMDIMHPNTMIDRNLYDKFMYGLMKLSCSNRRRVIGLELIHLEERKTKWRMVGVPPYDIKLTKKGKKLKKLIDNL